MLPRCLAARFPLAHLKLNVQRKAQHIFTGLALTAVFLAAPHGTCVLALGAGTLSLGLLQVMRMASKTVDQEFLKVFGAMLKEEERCLASSLGLEGMSADRGGS